MWLIMLTLFMNLNITHNFSAQKSTENVLAGQPMAIMPVGLAKQLLEMYAEKLRYATAGEIIKRLIKSLDKCADDGDLTEAVTTAIDWVAERELIQNIVNENWGAYEVLPNGAPSYL